MSAVWCVMVTLVNPVGDFPLNDDWAYGWSVRVLLESGNFQLSDWSAISPLSQVMWGALFCLPSGFSFTPLRLSTLVLGLAGVIATYGVLQEAHATPRISLLGALTIAVNPIYFALSNSFMSDVPSFALLVGSAYFLIRALTRDSGGDLVAGLAVASLSILNRPNGLVVLPAFGLAYLIGRGVTPRNLVRAALPGVLGLALHLSYSYWLEISGRLPYLHNLQVRILLKSISRGFVEVIAGSAQNLATAATYIGLFLFPFLLMRRFDSFRPGDLKRTGPRAWLLLVLVALAGVLAARYRRLPWIGNVLEFAGIGPSWISEEPGPSDPVVLIHRAWQVMTVLGIAGAVLLCRAVFRGVATVSDRAAGLSAPRVAVFAAATIVLLLVPIGGLPAGYWFDRYLLPLLPFSMLLAATPPGDARHGPRTPRAAVAAAMTLVLLYGGFTVAATHDYLAWSRASWQAATGLLHAGGLSPRQVSAGFEFRGWYLGNRLELCNPGHRQSADPASAGWSDFSCLASDGGEKYAVAPVPDPKSRVEKTYAFRRWLFFRDQSVYVLRRTPGGD